MTTIYKSYIRPKYALEQDVQEKLLGSEALTEADVGNLINLSEKIADFQVGLDTANQSTMCSNGKTVSYNLTLMRQLKYLVNSSKKKTMPPAALVMLENRIDRLMQAIREANNKEID